MQKIVFNGCHGGFGLTDEAMREYFKRTGTEVFEVPAESSMRGFSQVHFASVPDADPSDVKFNDKFINDRDLPRDDPHLVAIVEEWGDKVNAMCANLKVAEIPDGVAWEIEEYDGLEWITEKHRTWP